MSQTNYFKQVSDFGKDVFTSELSNSGTTYNIFDFFVNNIIVLILLSIIILAIYGGLSYFKKQNKIKQRKTINDSFHHSQLDNTEDLTVRCNDMDIPRQITKYTYAFNLTINDFYCNKGKWKCIMLKGIDMSDFEPQECKRYDINTQKMNINQNISPEHCFQHVCNEEKMALLRTRFNPNELEMRVDPDNLNQRVDLICRATKMGDEGKDLLACAMSKCSMMGKNMLRGHANSFIDAHKEYCTKVYTSSHKVDKDTDKRYEDQVDNVCSNKVLMEKYPHLIPRDLTSYYNSKETLDRNNIENYDDITSDHTVDETTQTIESCWDDLVTNLPIQAPGVWLHPYVNNIRIVLTTYSDKEFDKDNYNFSHSHDRTSFTENKYRISKINKDANGTEHPNVQTYESERCSTLANIPTRRNENVYREFFDIENIPIKEMFHFCLVINENTCEVYINAQLVKTQVLFGEPRYNKGDLYLNKKGNLNGSIMDFKYISHALNQQNVLNLLHLKPIIQDTDVSGIKINKEHEHDLKFVHTHKYESNTEEEHKHTLEEEDIDTEYNIE